MTMPRVMMRMMAALLYPCAEVTRLVSESLDRDLSYGQRARLRLHFLLCVLCRRYHDQLHFLRKALRSHPERLVGHDPLGHAGLSSHARERLKRAISQR